MKLVKFLIVLLLAGAIFGTAGFFAWKLFLQPEQLDRKEEKEVAQAAKLPPTPPPDYSLPALERALAIARKGDPQQARQALLEFIAQHPQSTKLSAAKDALGEINTWEVFTAAPAPEKVEYTVAPGDSLVKIAGKTKTNAELILRSNNLASIDLSIGQRLLVPQLDTSLVIDRGAKTLSVMNKGQLFKEYALLALDLPAAARGKQPVQTKVSDKIALKDSERVAFGGKDYVGSERWLMLALANVVIRGRPLPDEAGNEAPLPPGIVVSQEDIEEIFPLVTRGTSVTIQ
jgi:LysM repeat protein